MRTKYELPTQFIIFFIALLFFYSCKKDPVVPVGETPKKPTWMIHSDVELDRRLLIESFTTEDNLFLLSNNYWLKMNEQGLQKDHLISEEGNLSLYKKPMLNGDLFAIGLRPYHLAKAEIHVTQHPEIFATIDLFAIDSTFKKIHYFSGNGMAANGAGKLLFNVKKYTDISDKNTYLWMFDYEIQNENLIVHFDQEIVINLGVHNTEGAKAITELSTRGEDFYCSFTRPVRTYKINPQGEYEYLFPMRDAKIFTQNDTLFAIGQDNQCLVNYYIKVPQSTTWEGHNLNLYNGCWFRFYQVDKSFILLYRHQFWHLTVNHSNNTFTTKELDNTGLPTSSISSISYFKGKVYLATLDGLYWKNIDDFFIYKEE